MKNINIPEISKYNITSIEILEEPENTIHLKIYYGERVQGHRLNFHLNIQEVILETEFPRTDIAVFALNHMIPKINGKEYNIKQIQKLLRKTQNIINSPENLI